MVFINNSTSAKAKVELYDGAGGRTRTGTVSLPVDFESTTSANSITPAQHYVLYNNLKKKSSAFWKNKVNICRFVNDVLHIKRK